MTKLECPRCGGKGYLERRVVEKQTYYYVRHVSFDGGRRSDHRCYLGPERYDYVEKTHHLHLSGYLDEERFRRYAQELVDKLPEEQLKELRAIIDRRLRD
jgi:hypothetical protein